MPRRPVPSGTGLLAMTTVGFWTGQNDRGGSSCYNLAMKFKSSLGKTVELTSERKKHILIRHPDLKPYFKLIKDALLKPDELKISKSDLQVLLFYKFFGTILNGKYIAVGVKLNKRSFILTAYLTNRILTGEDYAKK